jgi:hypothetical protein
LFVHQLGEAACITVMPNTNETGTASCFEVLFGAAENFQKKL